MRLKSRDMIVNKVGEERLEDLPCFWFPSFPSLRCLSGNEGMNILLAKSRCGKWKNGLQSLREVFGLIRLQHQ